jgi:hypothetical protein
MKVQEIELELRMHSENMAYKQDKDIRVLENARLALLNQGAVVAAMSALADAIWGTRQGTVPSTAAGTDAAINGTTEQAPDSRTSRSDEE